MGSGERGERWEGIKHEDRAQDVYDGQVPTLRHTPLLCSGSEDQRAGEAPRKWTKENGGKLFAMRKLVVLWKNSMGILARVL